MLRRSARFDEFRRRPSYREDERAEEDEHEDEGEDDPLASPVADADGYTNNLRELVDFLPRRTPACAPSAPPSSRT